MNRRTALSILGTALAFPSRLLKGVANEAKPRWVMIFDSLAGPSRFEKLIHAADRQISFEYPLWQGDLTLWDIRFNEKEVGDFIVAYGANTQTFNWPVLIEVPDSRLTGTEVQVWTEDWLRHANQRFEDGCYPISGGWWSVEGDWHPTLAKVRDHLYQSPNHTGGKFQLAWLELLKFEELQSLHSDHHREMEKHGKVAWKNVNAECPDACTPQPVAYTGSDRTIKKGESVTLGGMPAPDSKYHWTPKDSLDEPLSSAPTASPTKTTVYTLQVTTPCGTTSKKVTVVVTK